VIVNHKHRLIFLHVPKTAGMSVIRQLAQAGVDNDITKLPPHTQAQHLKELLGSEIWNSYFKFAVVRHPLDRMVSAYHFFDQKSYSHGRRKLKFIGFPEYVEQLRTRGRRDNIFMPQARFLHPGVDQVCRFESLEADLGSVFARFGLPAAELPHANASTHDHYLSYYTQDLVNLVADYYSKDFEQYGYHLPGNLNE